MNFTLDQKKYKNWGPGLYIKTALGAWGRLSVYGDFLFLYMINFAF